MDNKLIILFFCSLFILFICIRIAIYLEKKGFNNGVCPICGNKLSIFETWSKYNRGYLCHRCGYNTLVSYSSVDKKFREENCNVY